MHEFKRDVVLTQKQDDLSAHRKLEYHPTPLSFCLIIEPTACPLFKQTVFFWLKRLRILFRISIILLNISNKYDWKQFQALNLDVFETDQCIISSALLSFKFLCEILNKQIPPEVLAPDVSGRLRSLDLGNNSLSLVPHEIVCFKNLKSLTLDNNSLGIRFIYFFCSIILWFITLNR